MKLNKFFTAVGLLALAAGFTACDDDDVYITPGFEGVDGQVVLAPTSNETYKFVKIPTGIMAPAVTWTVTPKARVNATEPVTVKFEIDNSLIAEYNAANGTDCVALPEGLLIITNPEVTIPVGDNKAETSVNVMISDDTSLYDQLALDVDYVVPVRMTSVVAGDAKIAKSTSNVSYLSFSMIEKLINEGGQPIGSLVLASEKTGWTMTNEGFSFNWTSALNANDASGWSYSSGRFSDGCSTVVDFGAPTKFSGFAAYGAFGSESYTPFVAGTEFYYSNDGANWTSIGILESRQQEVALYAVLEAQYVKMVFHTSGYKYIGCFSIFGAE